MMRSFVGDYDPQYEVEQETGHTSRNQCEQKSQPEPQSAYAKEFSQPTAHTRKNAILP
jgi:hypothetical protein